MNRPYHPEALNKYAYCLGDPINYLDPDGRDPITGPHTIVTVTASPPVGTEILGNLPIGGGGEPGIGLLIDGGEGGGVALETELAARLANTTQLEFDLKYRAGVGNDQQGRCFDFLLKVIAQLNEAKLLANDLSIGTLVGNIMASTRRASTHRQLGANARTVGNTIRIAEDPVEPMGNDYISTLLHEGFHLLMSGRGSQITDAQLADATSQANGTTFPRRGNPSVFYKQMFGQNCNP